MCPGQIIYYLFLLNINVKGILSENWWNLKCLNIIYPEFGFTNEFKQNVGNQIEEKNMLLLAYIKDSRLRTSGVFLKDNSSIKTRCNWYNIRLEGHYSETPTITVMNKCNTTDSYLSLNTFQYPLDWEGLNYKCDISDQLTVVLQIQSILQADFQFLVIQFCSNVNHTEFGFEYWIFVYDSYLLKNNKNYKKLKYELDSISNNILALMHYKENLNFIKPFNHLKSQCNCNDTRPIVEFKCRPNTNILNDNDTELNVTDFFHFKTVHARNGIINFTNLKECKWISLESTILVVPELSFVFGLTILLIIGAISISNLYKEY